MKQNNLSCIFVIWYLYRMLFYQLIIKKFADFILRLNIAYFAVAEGWLLLDIGWFVLFL